MAAGWRLGLEICNPFTVSSTQYFPIILNPDGSLKVAQKDTWSSGLNRGSSTVAYAVGITRRGAFISFLSLFAGRSARSTQAKRTDEIRPSLHGSCYL